MRLSTDCADRLALKTDAHSLSHTLTTRYSLSPAEADCLTHELREKQLEEDPLTLLDGQIFYTVVDRDEPAGKPLSKCRTVRVRLSLHQPEDLTYRAEHGLAALQQLLVSRLCHEAFQQGGLLAQEDLCRLLYLSRATIQRILAAYRRACRLCFTCSPPTPAPRRCATAAGSRRHPGAVGSARAGAGTCESG